MKERGCRAETHKVDESKTGPRGDRRGDRSWLRLPRIRTETEAFFGGPCVLRITENTEEKYTLETPLSYDLGFRFRRDESLLFGRGQGEEVGPLGVGVRSDPRRVSGRMKGVDSSPVQSG